MVHRLHAAHLAGDPRGKLLLTGAGSKSLKMVDVFKSQPGWRRLILSNRRGGYRLAIETAPADPTARGVGSAWDVHPPAVG